MCILNTALRGHTSQPAYKVGPSSALQQVLHADRWWPTLDVYWDKVGSRCQASLVNVKWLCLKIQRGKMPFCLKANFLRKFVSISRPSC